MTDPVKLKKFKINQLISKLPCGHYYFNEIVEDIINGCRVNNRCPICDNEFEYFYICRIKSILNHDNNFKSCEMYDHVKIVTIDDIKKKIYMDKLPWNIHVSFICKELTCSGIKDKTYHEILLVTKVTERPYNFTLKYNKLKDGRQIVFKNKDMWIRKSKRNLISLTRLKNCDGDPENMWLIPPIKQNNLSCFKTNNGIIKIRK